MKIWIANHYATSQFRDQSGRHFWFAQELIKNSYEPTIFCASVYHETQQQIDLQGQPYSIQNDESANIPFIFVKVRNAKGNGFKRILNMTDFYFGLSKAMRSYATQAGKPDIILASSVHPLTLVAGLQMAKEFKVPCICEIRDLWPEAIFSYKKCSEHSLIGKLLINREHWIYKNADALIFTKEGDTDYLRERRWTTEQDGDVDLAKCYYINNGIDIETFDDRICQYSIDDDDLKNKFNVTYTGTLRPVNHVEMILECAALLKNNPKIQFQIYGDGESLPELQKQVESNILTNVSLNGFVSRKMIPSILSRSSVNLLHYSQNSYNWSRGNSSNKLFEYMASGKPIISTVKMGYSPIKKFNCGIELNENTPDALAKAIIELYNMPEVEYDQLGQNARAAALQFDFKKLTSDLIQIIEKVKQKAG